MTWKNEYDCDVEWREISSNELQGIFIQDNEMKNMFDSYPKIIFADSTYELFDVDYTLFLRLFVYTLEKNEVERLSPYGLSFLPQYYMVRFFEN